MYLPRHQTVHTVDAKPLAKMEIGMGKQSQYNKCIDFLLENDCFLNDLNQVIKDTL